MTLTVQNDTGTQAGADAYIAQAFFETWAEKNNRDISSYTDEAIEGAIREATQYVDTVGRYKAVTLEAEQTTEFPRNGLVDWSGRAVTGVPARVKNATCELTFSRLSSGASLYSDLDRGGQVAAESVGPISVSYRDGAPVGKLYHAAMQLLKPYFRDPNQAFAPYIGGVAGKPSDYETPDTLTPAFTLGMHENSSS